MTGTFESGKRCGWIAAALWAALCSLHNALPYLHVRDDSCQTMFSSLDQGVDWNNHTFMPQTSWGDQWRYVELHDVAIEGDARDEREAMLSEWLSAPSHAFNMEALRVVNAQLCEAHRISFSYRAVDVPASHALIGASVHSRDEVRTRFRAATPFAHVEDACRESRWSSPNRLIPVRLFETDFPVRETSEQSPLVEQP